MRTRFKLPFSLNVNQLDLAINLSSKNGIQFKRQVTLRVLLIAMLGFLLYLMLVLKTPMGISGGFLGLIIWSVGYIWILFKICTPTLTKQVGMSEIMPMIKYLDGRNRKVTTKKISFKNEVESLIGIVNVDEDTGLIEFNTGEIGYVYEVIGNASILMFDDDRDRVLQGTRNFYRKITPNVSIIFDYVTQPQKVDRNVQHVISQFDDLQYQSKGLKDLLVNQAAVLDNFVGQQFKSMHQFMIVRAKDRDSLNDLENWIAIQMETNFLKSCRGLSGVDTLEYLKDMYLFNKK